MGLSPGPRLGTPPWGSTLPGPGSAAGSSATPGVWSGRAWLWSCGRRWGRGRRDQGRPERQGRVRGGWAGARRNQDLFSSGGDSAAVPREKGGSRAQVAGKGSRGLGLGRRRVQCPGTVPTWSPSHTALHVVAKMAPVAKAGTATQPAKPCWIKPLRPPPPSSSPLPTRGAEDTFLAAPAAVLCVAAGP